MAVATLSPREVSEFPGTPRHVVETIEAAITYARSHPPVGRPSARPWTDVV